MSRPIFVPMRFFLFLAGIVLLSLGATGGARAQSCNDDLANFGKQRTVAIEALNGITKTHGGKLDPIAACPFLRKLSSIEKQMSAYMVKNKEWCNIPDEFYNNFQANIGRTTKIADQACTMAEQAKKMQSQGGMGAAPPPIKLPAGPL